MPIFEYACRSCQKEFELLSLPGETVAVECPHCGGSDAERKLSAAAIRPNGIPTGAGGFKPPPSCSGGCRG